MSVSSDNHWYPLVITSRLPENTPPLLINTKFSANSYDIHITDLTYVWGESLSRRDIIRRALIEDTSIDPSEDASQMKIFMEKLKKALRLCDDINNEDDDIEVDISIKPSQDNIVARTSLDLKVIIDLPAPLPPLIWTFQLQPLPQKKLTTMFLLPLLSLTSLHVAEIRSLVRVIKEKDLVFDKIQDSLERTKSSIFDLVGAAPSRRRGLERFDAIKWRTGVVEQEESLHPTSKAVVRNVFGDNTKNPMGDMQNVSDGSAFDQDWEHAMSKIDVVDENSQDTKEWWHGIDHDETSRRQKRPKKTQLSKSFLDKEPDLPPAKGYASSRNEKGKRRTGYDSDEDEFEAQKTPPPFMSDTTIGSSPVASRTAKVKVSISSPPPVQHTKTEARSDTGSDTEDDSDELESKGNKSPIRSPVQVQTGNFRRSGLGTIGGKRTQRAVSSVPQQPSKSAGSDTEDEQDTVSASESKHRVQGIIGGKIKSKIGGKLKQENRSSDTTTLENPSNARSSADAKDQNQRSGTVTPAPGQSMSIKKEESPTRQEPAIEQLDEEEIADRKRRQLQLELEAKQKAARKRRKF